MKSLVVYYSRTGTTKQIAEELAQKLEADLDEIIDQKSRKGVIGWLKAGRASQGRKTTEIRVEKDPEDYELVILGTPIWAGRMTPAMRTYLQNHDFSKRKVAFFTSQGGEEPLKAITEMRKMVEKSEIISVLSVRNKDVQKNQYETRLQAFVESLN